MHRHNSGHTILCVDDHALGLKIRKQLLELVGYKVLTATSVHEALEVFRRNDIDLVLTEHVAPAIVDGPTPAATMKMLKPEVPIAIFSADVAATREDIRFADAFITKLVSVDELLREIRRLLRKRMLAHLPRAA
jgi:two-component system, OmpR family, response regulator CpxR